MRIYTMTINGINVLKIQKSNKIKAEKILFCKYFNRLNEFGIEYEYSENYKSFTKPIASNQFTRIY